ncbi:hypothetical protein LRS74_00270 [Streptomyces sp. LX-29]|uniref:hypothetical protein n=1 Tax=Streptomyces sp. LX-29 TaxID=2900152 RepID=UPI00240DA363|nr:hypothetical protein [Streptomyces sp. LX-29]WFB05621.1 hypothetical protein LRS74_00270 [Streptomyces sp. LX-29]
MLVHHGRKGERKGFRERDFAALLDAAHQQLGELIVDLNPAEGVWAHLKDSLGSLASCSLDELAALARTRPKRMHYKPSLLNGFIAETGLIPTPP